MNLLLSENVLQNVQALMKRTGQVITHPVRQQLTDFFIFPRPNKAIQLLLAMKYKEMAVLGLPLPGLDEVEFRAYSQFGEDGILLFLFSVLGTTNKKCVEVCGGGSYDNTMNLIVNHGWNGLFFDGNKRGIERGSQFYARCASTKLWPPKLIHAWVTAGNINQLLEEQGYTGEIDLLSLDMDGVDYWVWKAIECIRPRVVVLEYNAALGPDVSLTIPYQEDFRVEFSKKENYIRKAKLLYKRAYNALIETPIAERIAERYDHYFGASLSAFVELGRQKGYYLVGCERHGYNAFFVRSDIGRQILPEVEPADCFKYPFTQYISEIHKERLSHKKWVEV
jgi:hypothetical protein